jgi:fumarate reductase flavoprotein subunit
MRAHAPGIADALFFGHPGNRGEALAWGEALGAATRHLGAYQGHGNVAHPHGILITWATITEGGFQVNREGARFWNEAEGYSEAARAVLAQPGGEAFTIFDDRIAGIARQFGDFRAAEAQGAVRRAASVAELAVGFGLPAEALGEAAAAVEALARAGGTDGFGRRFAGPPLAPPYLGVRVTGALFHTQGGLVTDPVGRVLDRGGRALPNLWAGGGAACGVSGPADWGYLSGNGLLTAVVLGRLAGAGGHV